MPLTITLVERDENVLAGNNGAPRPLGDQSPVDRAALAGITVRDLTAEERSQLRVDGGVLVRSNVIDQATL